MAAVRPVIGYEFSKRLCKALGLDGHNVHRLVIDVSCDGVVIVYVQKFLTEDEEQPVLDALASCTNPEIREVEHPPSIDEKGNIFWQ